MKSTTQGNPAQSSKTKFFVSLYVIVCVLVVFYPVTKIGFLGDDWWEVANAGRMSAPEFLRFYFDPSSQTIWYRPLHGLLLLGEYQLFGSNAEGYRIVQILLHGLNSLLLFTIGYQLTRRWQWAFVAAMIYAVLFPGATALYGIAVHDPLATTFYLLTVFAWILYLRTRQGLYFAITIGTYLLALLSKETSAVLIVTLFLVDRIFVPKPCSFLDLLKRYLAFCLILSIYLAIEYSIQLQGHFANRAGYVVGMNIAENAMHYLRLLIFPWDWDKPAAFIWLILSLGLVGAVAFQKPRPTARLTALIFLGLQAALLIAPVLAFPTIFFEPRYLYAASVVASIILAWLFNQARFIAASRRTGVVAAAGSLVLFLVLHSTSIANSAVELGELNRQQRVPFRDIVQQHPSFPSDTYLYLINPPYLLKHAAPSMFFFRYGSNVSIGSVDSEWWGKLPQLSVPGLREHQNSFVYYYDEQQVRIEIPVDPDATTVSTPSPPINFQVPIRLQGYDVTSTLLKPGSYLVLLLNWQATGTIERDYTVFVHLVNADGQIIIGEDSEPQNGATPTTQWKKGKLVVDAHILPITSDIPIGENYHLEVGLYYPPTLERLGILDMEGKVTADTIIIQDFNVGD